MTRLLVRVLSVAVAGVVVVSGCVLALAALHERRVSAEAAPQGGRFVPAGDVRVFVQEAGPPNGPLAVFLHGTGAWSETWRATLTAAAGAGWHAVALDLPPFGYSDRPANARYAKPDQAARIVALVDALGPAPAVLVGHSFGGGPTAEAALRAPARVRALVLVDAALAIAPDDTPPPPASPPVRALLALGPVRRTLVAGFLTNPWFTRRLIQGFVADPDIATDALVAIYQRPLAVAGTTAAVTDWLPELVAPPSPSRSEAPSAYRELTMPVVAIWGARDTVTPLAQGERVVGLVPHGRLEVMPSVGHIPQIEDPDGFNALLLRVLATLPPA